MKPKFKNTTCPDVTSNQCVVWEGGEIKCLGICNGDSLAEAEKIIADKVCELAKELDLGEVDLSCILATDPADKNLKKVLEVILENQCTLKELVDSINTDSPDTGLNLNLKCLKRFDEFGNEIPQDLTQVLQSAVNMLCVHDNDIALLKNRLGELEDYVETIPTTPPEVEEPKINTCLTPGLRSTSEVVPMVAQEVCDLKTIVGSLEEVSSSLSQQCSNLNATYQIEQGWQTTVNNIAQAIGNIWIVLCDVKDRLTLIENNCCGVTCDDIKLGFEVQPSEDGTGVFLKFTSKAGTKIPNGFTDCGSEVIFTDKAGNSQQYPLTITNNGTLGDFDITGLDLTDFINIEVTAKLCADGIGCEKCVSRLYKMGNALCPYCTITVTGEEGAEVIIIYEE